MRRPAFSAFLLLGVAACSGASESEAAERAAPDAKPDEAPFYEVEKNGTGPLAMDELKVDIPEDLEAKMGERRRACFLEKVEQLAGEAGDPETLSTADVAFLPEQEEWDEFTRYGKRSLLAQAIISRAITLC